MKTLALKELHHWNDYIDTLDRLKMLIDPQGTYAVTAVMAFNRTIDDIIITKVSENEYLCVSNAVTDYRIEAWLNANTKNQKIENLTKRYILLAIQGPKSEGILQKITNYDLKALKRFRADFIHYQPQGASSQIPKAGGNREGESPPEAEGSGQANLAERLSYEPAPDNPIPTITSRTGYTGEDGFEILTPKSAGSHLWRSLLRIGEGAIAPVGIGARDTLRLEKGYLLSGQDFDGSQTPLETGHERLIKWDHDFIGKGALSEKKGKITKKLVGLLCSNERVVPRKGTTIHHGGRKIGTITSGTQSPCLRRGIGLGYVEIEYSDIGHVLELQIRSRRESAEVVKLPFV